ncbi:MAG: rRNA pseudouridine synthase [Deltaproteobacteria bacterium]|nr:rRNA pseudouridine synthase [Deltaproteobacteria bacterium]
MASERLQKILAQAGIASRRAAERYIKEGRVKVNGAVVSTLGSKADPAVDRIAVDGHGVLEAQAKVYIAMHKPKNVVTTVSDPEGRTTVMDVLGMSRAVGPRQHEGEMPRVYPVGRLDFDAEGLLMLTNDGELAHALLHPRHHVPKTYVVKIKGKVDPKAIERLKAGVRLRQEDGSRSPPTAPASASIVRESPANTWLELVIVEGRHHQVKKMCEAVGHRVIRLIRTDFGGITLEPLAAGAWRFLTNAEIRRLQSWVGKAAAPERAPKAHRPVDRQRRPR